MADTTATAAEVGAGGPAGAVGAAGDLDPVDADRLVLELLLDPAVRAEPYEHYRRLREGAPVHRAGFAPVWCCTRYDDCREALRDPHMVQPGTELPGDPDPDDPSEDDPGAVAVFGPRRRIDDPIASRSLLRLNPPDHTRLRGLVSRGFTPRRVEALRPAVEALTDRLLDDLEEAGEVDLLDALGFPLPVQVIGELVGVPAADRDRFRSLVRAAANALEPGITDEEWVAAGEASSEMQAYFTELIAERRRTPRDDLASALVAVQRESTVEGGEAALTDEEMIATLILIFAAGFETTTNLIGNGVHTLLHHPDELARLRGDPSLDAAAVEEILRYQSPVQMDGRRAATDTVVGGRPVAAGEWVLTFLGAANRDPARFEDPERFHIRERPTPVLSFATGIHYCLGASLARLEGQVVFRRLLDRFGTIELTAEPTWRNTFILRGLDGLPVRVRR
jgi:cytochrome P450